MVNTSNVQNGTNVVVGLDVGTVASVSSDSSVNVTASVSKHDKYKIEFNAWSKKTAQSTLEMCRVVYEAKKELVSQDFLKFCLEIGRKGEDATVRKYLKIGEKYDQFYQYAELLPNSWTSIYEITQLPSETFEALIATENSLAYKTGDEIKLLMGKKTEDKSKSADKTEANVAIAAAPQNATTTASSATTSDVTAQNSSQASVGMVESSSNTKSVGTAVASTDANQNELSKSDVESTTVSANATSLEPSSASDHQFAQQATNMMLKRVVATASTHVDVKAEENFVPYEITIRFNSKPSDIAIEELVESIVTIKSKYRLDFDFVQQNAFAE
jgi:hypothetical protein